MRTIQTAMPLSIEKKCPLEKKPELNEVKVGIFEGQHKEEFSDAFFKKLATVSTAKSDCRTSIT
ncbi:MAG: histidine phosphatase family protein [Pseudomonadales bacterium]